VLWDVLAWVENWLTVELNSSNDNPLFDSAKGVVLSGGNFSGGHVALAMDSLKTALASIADLMDRQLEFDRRREVQSRPDAEPDPGLPSRASPAGPQPRLQGHATYLLVTDRRSAQPLHAADRLLALDRVSQPGQGLHGRDRGPPRPRRRDIGGKVAAIHLLALCQAADLRGPDKLASRTRLIYERIRAMVPMVDNDRPMADDIAAVLGMLRTGVLTDGFELD
jgi:hypothetical protein